MNTAPVKARSTIHFKNILYSTDFSDSSHRALRYAEALAEKFGATLCLCHAVTPSAFAVGAPEAAPYLYEAEYEGSQRDLSNLQVLEKKRGLTATTVLQSGNLEDVLNGTITEKNIDLVVAGTHGRTGVSRLLLGSSAEDICRSSTCAVLTAGPGPLPSAKVQFRSILFPTDLTEESLRVLPYILAIAEQYQSEITILNVMPLNAGIAEAKNTVQSKTQAMEAVLCHKLAPYKHEYLVDFGDTTQTVLRVAREKKSELIALGVRHGFAGPHLRSSIAHRIQCEANCPVLTTR